MAGGKAKHLFAAKQTAGEGRVEQADHLQAGKAAHPGFQPIQFTGGIGGTDKAADGAASDQIRFDAEAFKGADDADMGPSSGGAAPESEPYAGFTWHDSPPKKGLRGQLTPRVRRRHPAIFRCGCDH